MHVNQVCYYRCAIIATFLHEDAYTYGTELYNVISNIKFYYVVDQLKNIKSLTYGTQQLREGTTDDGIQISLAIYFPLSIGVQTNGSMCHLQATLNQYENCIA